MIGKQILYFQAEKAIQISGRRLQYADASIVPPPELPRILANSGSTGAIDTGAVRSF